IGLYRSSRNRILYNRVDWNVRRYSFGVYYRGQDSGGILVFEQSSNNEIACNSVTHSGDGLFLWAGETTLRTGKGGCNDNLVYANDFSYAPTNAIEVTFSRNRIIGNILHDSWHGIWGGFSYNTVIARNDFRGNLSAIAIEHGNNNIIDQNTFQSDGVGIELWSDPNRRKEGGFLEKRDTRSRQYSIRNNSFIDEKKPFFINHTAEVNIGNNRITGVKGTPKFDSTVKDLVYAANGDAVDPMTDSSYLPVLAGLPGGVKGNDVLLKSDHPKGKKYIMMTPWGPYNFRYPIIWWSKTDSVGKMSFDLIGPPGKWKILHMKGVSHPSASGGVLPGELTVEEEGAIGSSASSDASARLKDIDIELEYLGEEVISPLGTKIRAGRPYQFHYREFRAPLFWQMKWFAFDSTNDPIKNGAAFERMIKGAPLKKTEGKDLSDVFGNGFGKRIATEKIATVSTTGIDVPAGTYRIGISASEIVKLYIDDKLIIDAWDPAAIIYDADYHRDAVIDLKGKHTVKVEQAQYGGYGMLFFTIQPVDLPDRHQR
ncbi:MAG: NosD domain-containing protein, partial [Bacteroidota bacterium]